METLLKEIADYNIDSFLNLGYAPAGCNGPYNDQDTPMRNTAHWCVTFYYLYHRYGDERYKDILLKFKKYLMNPTNYGISGAAICRKDKGDKTNGLIGQAWVIEGLVYLYKMFHDDEVLMKAMSVYYSQKFDKSNGLWIAIDIDGRMLGYDISYNHHLWLAAAGALLLTCKYVHDIDYQIKAFLDHSWHSLAVQPTGIFFHYCNHKQTWLSSIKFWLRGILTDIGITSRYSTLKKLEKGYHIFDLYGFALLYTYKYASHPFFKSYRFQYSLYKGINENYLLSLTEKDIINYSFSYNSPAFEYPFVAKTFGQYREKTAMQLFGIQKDIFFDSMVMKFANCACDANTLTARLYEYVHFLLCDNLVNVKE